jgi:hypothetical protein
MTTPTTSLNPLPHIIPVAKAAGDVAKTVSGAITGVVSDVGRATTGGGIVKTPGDAPVGVDETYDVEFPAKGLPIPKTTGDMAAQSIEEQTRTLTFDEFKAKISSGDIPTVARIPQGNLQNDILLSDPNAQGITPENKQAAQERLENAFLMYSEQQPAVTPLEFGTQTGEGEYVFTPTEEARENPELRTVQERIFDGKKQIARVVSGAFTDRVMGPDGQPLKRKKIKQLSRGHFVS